MHKNLLPKYTFFNSRCLLATLLCLSGVFLTALSFARTPREIAESAKKRNSIVTKHDSSASTLDPTLTATSSGPSGPGWSIVASPNEGSGQWNLLHGVTCLSPSDCWAVGAHRSDSGFDQTLIEHWNGRAWSIVPSPNSSPQNSYLWSVTCPSPNECWAVGDYSNGTAMQTQIEHWDGVSWTIISSPNANTQSNYLSGITCVAVDQCWAVGSYDSGSDLQTLIERWDGISWSIVSSPDTHQKSQLFAVTCISGSDCWAVGGDFLGSTLTEHWDGNAWSIAASPAMSNYAQLFSIKCTSSDQCWATGRSYTGDGTSAQALIEQWNGTSWSIEAAPSPGTSYSQLTGITCLSASDCWAVGYYNPAGTLVEHWDGASWSVISSPNPVSGFGSLSGVYCLSESQCWSVGQYLPDSSNSDSQTLIEEFSATIPPLISISSRLAHGTIGAFDVDLPITGKRGVESRSGGANGNYSVVFSFVNDVANCGTAATTGGTVVAGPNSNQCTENLTGIANAQYVNVELDNVVDSQNNAGNIAVQMGVLTGDTNADGFVDAIDASQTKSQSGNVVSGSNFREDINADGFVDAVDTSFVKSKTGTALPSSP